MAFERQKLTKCEKLILKHISTTGECDYSFSEMSKNLGISRQAVYLCLNSLLEDKYIEKSYFFIGKIKRCKYSIVNFFAKKTSSKNFTMQKEGSKNFTSSKKASSKNFTSSKKASGKNFTSSKKASGKNFTSYKKASGKNFTSYKKASGKNFTSYKNEGGKNFTRQNKLEERNNKAIGLGWVKSLWHKKEPSRKTRLTKNLINDLDIYNINNIYNISNQSNNTMVLRTCQEVKSNFFKKIDKIFINITKGNITSEFKRVIKKISCEKNENSQNVKKFINEFDERDISDVILSAIQSVTRRLADKTKEKIRNIYGYIRMVIINAVQAFYASQIDESEVKTLLYESVKQLAGRPAPSHTYNIPATSKKIDTRYLARNFEQREYPKEYFESFYETFKDEQSVPATSSPAPSSCAKDSVMEQVQAMRDSFSDRGRIKPVLCVDLW